MGAFSSPLQISSMEGGEVLEIEATVPDNDTGATYTNGAFRYGASIGRRVNRQSRIRTPSDGRIVELEMGRVWVTIDGASEVSLVIFGEDGEPHPSWGPTPLKACAWQPTRCNGD